jgi:hypothetical protein
VIPVGYLGRVRSSPERKNARACTLVRCAQSARPSLTFHFRACIARVKLARDRARISVITADPLRIRCVKSTEKFSRLSDGAPTTFPNARASLAQLRRNWTALIDKKRIVLSRASLPSDNAGDLNHHTSRRHDGRKFSATEISAERNFRSADLKWRESGTRHALLFY